MVLTSEFYFDSTLLEDPDLSGPPLVVVSDSCQPCLLYTYAEGPPTSV